MARQYGHDEELAVVGTLRKRSDFKLYSACYAKPSGHAIRRLANVLRENNAPESCVQMVLAQTANRLQRNWSMVRGVWLEMVELLPDHEVPAAPREPSASSSVNPRDLHSSPRANTDPVALARARSFEPAPHVRRSHDS